MKVENEFPKKTALAEEELKNLKEKLASMTFGSGKATFVQKQAEKKARSFKQWPINNVIKK